MPAPADTRRLRTPPGGVSVPSPLRGPDSIYGGSGPRGRSGAPSRFGLALTSPGHVATPDPSLSGKRVWDHWSDEVELDPRGPAAKLLRA